MSTLRQIEANRRNAQKSTGPNSVTGKAVSSMNALKTGIHAKSLVLSSENLADLEQLTAEYYHSHHPTSPEARVLLDDLIRCEWTLRRLGVAETQLFEYAHQEAYTVEDDFPLGQSCMEEHKPFGQLQWRLDSTRRALYRALHTLQQLEAAPASAPPVELDPPALDPPLSTPLTPNHFTPNRLRSFNPHRRPTPAGARRAESRSAPVGTVAHSHTLLRSNCRRAFATIGFSPPQLRNLRDRSRNQTAFSRLLQ